MLLGNTLAQQTPAATTPPASAAPASSAKAQTPAAKPHSATAAKTPVPLTLKTQKDKFSYALGMKMGQNLQKQSVPVDPAIVARGLKDGLAGGKSLLTLFGAEHSLGGISGYESTETTDESPERVALIQRLTTAYLRDALDLAGSDWPAAVKALSASTDPLGRIESK